jgi:hypothetical protein
MSRARTFVAGGLIILGFSLGCRHTQPQNQTDSSVAANTAPVDVPEQPLDLSGPKSSLVATAPPELVQTKPDSLDALPAPCQAFASAPEKTVVEQPAAPFARAPINFGEPSTTTASKPTPTPIPTPARTVKLNPDTAPVHMQVSAPSPTPAPTPIPVTVPSPTVLPATIPNPGGSLPTRVALPAPTPTPVSLPATVPVPTAASAPVAVATPVITSGPVATATPAPTHLHETRVASAPSEQTAPKYYNSPDYSILFGVLDFNARRGIWRLRYADAGDEDRYGGCVTLDGVGRQMDGYASGQFVRVEGALSDAESKAINPAYRVKDMRPADGK